MLPACPAAWVPQAAKTDTVSAQRMALLKPRGTAAAAGRPRADVVLNVKTSGGMVKVRPGFSAAAAAPVTWCAYGCC